MYSKFRLQVDGLQEAVDRLRVVLKRVQTTESQLKDLSRDIESEALARVPKLTGALQSTVSVVIRKHKNGVYYIKALAGGRVKGMFLVKKVDYAIEQHEIQYNNYTTSGTGPGYIKIPFENHTRRFIKNITKELGR